MARMVRKQICITDEIDQRLKAMAESRHISQSEIVRDALAAYADRADAERQARIEAMDRFLSMSEEIGKVLPPDWRPLTREEAHDRKLLRRLERVDLHEREDAEGPKGA